MAHLLVPVPRSRSVEPPFDPGEEIVEFVGTDAVGTPVGVALDRTAEFAKPVGRRSDATRRDHLVVRSAREEDRFALDALGLSVGVRIGEIAVQRDDPVVVRGGFEQQGEARDRALAETKQANALGIDRVRPLSLPRRSRLRNRDCAGILHYRVGSRVTHLLKDRVRTKCTRP